MDRLGCGFEFKFSEAEPGAFRGYGSVAGNIDSYGDIVAKGAFAETLEQHKAANTMPSMLLQHGMGMTVEDSLPIGVWEGMAEDDNGLMCEGKLCLGNQRADEAHRLMKMTPRPALTGLSIGYKATNSTPGTRSDKFRRMLNSVKLYEVSLVDTPANGKARIQSVKSFRTLSVREAEGLMRDAFGLSNSEAKQAASLLKPMLGLREEDDGVDHEFTSALKKLCDSILTK